MGSPPFANKALTALVDAGHNVVAVVSAPPNRRGRGRHQADNSIVQFANKHEIPVLQPVSAKSKEFKEQFAQIKCDLATVVSYGQILDKEFLRLPALGCVNVHASLLPRWRGASPIQSAIKAGDTQSGVCIQKMVLELDAGDVLCSSEIMLDQESTTPWLFDECAQKGAELLCDFIGGVARSGQLPEGYPQDEGLVTLCSKVRKQEGKIDWQHSAEDVYRQVRGNLGWPGAFTRLPNGDNLKIHEARLDNDHQSDGAAASVSIEDNQRVFVNCSTGTIELLTVQRAGKAKVSAREFLNGATLKTNDRLG